MLDLAAWAVAAMTAAMLMLVIRGFLAIALQPDGSAVYHLGRGASLILLAVSARALYWDGLPLILDAIEPGLWARWAAVVGKPGPNLIPGAITIAGAWHLLRLQLLLIPEHDRGRYSMWTAPFYPSRVCIVRGVEALRRAWTGNTD